MKVKLPKPVKKIKENPVKEAQKNKVNLEIPHHRGRGRPPKPKNLPIATSTPNTSPPSTATAPATAIAAAKPNAQLPPLRVAPFAKVSNTGGNALAATRPPPPLTMPPAPRPIRIGSHSTMNEPIKITGRFPLPKPSPTIQISSAPQQIRLLKDIQTSRASSTPSPSYPKLKQVPMRKTPYSLRPDRVIPDLDESFSPPPPLPPPPPPPECNENPHIQTNGHLPLNGIHRKRRSDWPPPNTNTLPTKFRRIPSDDEDSPMPSQKSHSMKEDNQYGKLLQNVIVDLSTSLRKVQTQMMKDFFAKQQELLQREHEFQMQQDRLIMETFQVQTFEIMKSVKELVGTLAMERRDQEQRLSAATKEADMEQRRRRHEKRYFQEMQEHHLEENERTNGIDYEQPQHDEEHNHNVEHIYSDDDDRSQEQQHHAEEHQDNTQENENDHHHHHQEEQENEELEDIQQNYVLRQQRQEVQVAAQQQQDTNEEQQFQSPNEQNTQVDGPAEDDDDDDDDEEDDSDSSDSDSDEDDDNDNEMYANTEMINNGHNVMAQQLMEDEDEEEED